MRKNTRQLFVPPVRTSLTHQPRVSVSKVAVGRSLGEFRPLLSGEEKLLLACQKGATASLGSKVPGESSDDVRVRASFLRFLLLGGDNLAPIHEHGVRLRGAFVEGRLDLAGCCIPHNISLKNCRFPERVIIQDAQVQGLITLEGSLLSKGILGDRLQCSGGVFLRKKFKTTADIRLLGAQIGGDLDCNEGLFEVKGSDALLLARAVVGGSIFLGNGFKSTGRVSLRGVQINGGLSCTKGLIDVRDGEALAAQGVVVNQDVFLGGGFKATGEVLLLGARISGSLNCEKGTFEVGGGDALSADGAVVSGDVFLIDGFKTTGEVRLLGAQIGGDLSCRGGRFEIQSGDALSANTSVIKGNVFFDEGFKSNGVVNLLNVTVGGAVICDGGKFEVESGEAFFADGIVVGGDVSFAEDFKATGQVRLLGAKIGGDLRCSKGQFNVNKGIALAADGVVVKGGVFFNDHFKATGPVRLSGAEIDGNLICTSGQFEAKKGVFALVVERAIVRGCWAFHENPQPVLVNAGHMQVGILVDAIDSWAIGVVLDGLRYSAFGGAAPTRADARYKWLCQQREAHLGETKSEKDFRPYPWRHLQRVLRETGHIEEARQIGIFFELQLRKAGLIGTSSRETSKPVAYIKRVVACFIHVCFGLLAGYGYRPMRLVFNLLLVWVACGIAYWFLALPPNNAIGPSDPLVFQNKDYSSCVPNSSAALSAKANGIENAGNWYLCEHLPAEYATFSPMAYSLDVILPFVDLGQEKQWGALINTPSSNIWKELSAHSTGHIVRFLIWFETLFGWVGSLLLVGIVSGFARRTEE